MISVVQRHFVKGLSSTAETRRLRVQFLRGILFLIILVFSCVGSGAAYAQTITWNISGSVTVDGGVYSVNGSVNLPAGGGSAGYAAAAGGITVTSTVGTFAISGIGTGSGDGVICQGAGGGQGPIVQTASGLSASGLISGNLHCDYDDGTSDNFPVTGSFSAAGAFDSSFPSTVSSITGTVQAIVNGTAQSISNGFHLTQGMEIKTGASGQATITFKDGSTVQVGPNSSFVLSSEGGTDKPTILDRIKGFLQHQVQCFALSSGGSCYRVRTPTACACVRGTKFSTNYTKTGNTGTLTTSVENGLVDVVDRKGNIVPVGAGQQFILNETLAQLPVDIDGDGINDIGIYRAGVWAIIRSSDNVNSVAGLGGATWTPVPADYDGDGKTDEAVYLNGTWVIVRSSDGQSVVVGAGGPAFVPVPADYDGDGRVDIAVYANGVWSITRSSDGGNTVIAHGGPGWIPVPADYDGDGKTDVAVYLNGAWSIKRSSDNSITVAGHGGPSWQPVPADYDGDGKADIAVYTNGAWSIKRTSDNGNTVVGHGGPAWSPVPADYDGDGKADIAVYHSAGAWSIKRSSNNAITVVGHGGAPQDIPLN